MHPAKAAELLVAGEVGGAFGELHPKSAIALGKADEKKFKELDPNERTCLVADLDLDAILGKVPERFAYRSVSIFPVVFRDVAVLMDAGTSAAEVLTAISDAGGELIKDVRLFDVYVGEHIPEGKKSLAFALTYQAHDRTLKDKEVEKAHKKIEERLRKDFKAQIRGKDGG